MASISETLEIPLSIIRQWRPNAQRNLRNQWSILSTLRHQWFSSSSSARSHATSLVNSYLSSRYLDDMDLGVLSDMPNIRKKARCKWLKQQELQVNQLLSSYKSMVGVVVDMNNLSRSMRCFMKATSGSPLTAFSSSASDSNDTGDGGGVAVYTFLPVSAFEMLAEELLEMFKQELLLKRLLVVALLSLTCQKHEQFNQLSWADELYHGETDNLGTCNMYSKETAEPCLPKLNGCMSESTYVKSDKHPSSQVLESVDSIFDENFITSHSETALHVENTCKEIRVYRSYSPYFAICKKLRVTGVYLTTWLAEVNIDTYRIEEIFAIVGEEIRASFS